MADDPTDADEPADPTDDQPYDKKHVGIALAIMGGALTAFIITAPLGIPLLLVGLWVWWRHR